MHDRILCFSLWWVTAPAQISFVKTHRKTMRMNLMNLMIAYNSRVHKQAKHKPTSCSCPMLSATDMVLFGRNTSLECVNIHIDVNFHST